MARTSKSRGKTPFSMKSNNKTSFKNMGSSPVKSTVYRDPITGKMKVKDGRGEYMAQQAQQGAQQSPSMPPLGSGMFPGTGRPKGPGGGKGGQRPIGAMGGMAKGGQRPTTVDPGVSRNKVPGGTLERLGGKGGQRPTGAFNPERKRAARGQKQQMEQFQTSARNRMGKGGRRPTGGGGYAGSGNTGVAGGGGGRRKFQIGDFMDDGVRTMNAAPAASPMAKKLSKEAKNLLKAVPNKKAYNKLSKIARADFNKAAKKYGFPMKNIKK